METANMNTDAFALLCSFGLLIAVPLAKSLLFASRSAGHAKQSPPETTVLMLQT
jgi:hypothetical protein